MNKKRKLVIEKLLEAIHKGDIVEGDKLLPERQLAEAVGETRPVLREALIALDAMGVLDIRDRQGIYLSSNEEKEVNTVLNRVRGWPADILSRAMEMRQIVEPLATGLAAARRNDKDLEKMRECLKHIRELAERDGGEAATQGAYWNTIFHTVIIESADNAYLSRVYEGIFSVFEQGMSLMRINTSPEAHGGRLNACNEHIRLYELIEKKDSANAEILAEEHLQHTIDAMTLLGQIVPTSDLFGQGFAGRRRFGQKSEWK